MNITARGKWLTGIAAGVAAYVVFGPRDAAPVAPARTAAAAAHRASVIVHGSLSEAQAHALLALAHRVVGQTSADALFATHSWYVAPPPPPPVVEAPVEPPKPVAPPLPFQYIGSYAPAGEAPVFFLSNGDRVYDVHVGDTLDNTYSVDSFNNGQLTFTFKPLNTKQQLAAGSVP
jgi:hypothetical protein